MKKIILLVALIMLTSVSLSRSMADPRGYPSNGKHYLESSSDLSNWGAGGYFESRDRDVIIDHDTLLMGSSEIVGYVSYDVIRWISIYGLAGYAQHDFGEEGFSSGNSGEYGFGAKFNFFNHEILDPLLLENRLAINGGLQYSASTADWNGEDAQINELAASLTIGLINDIEGHKLFVPLAIGIFGGGIYSKLFGDIEEAEALGATFGLDIYYSEKVTLEVRAEDWVNTTWMGGVHVRC